MRPMVLHPFLRDEAVEARAYQLEAVNACLATSTLLVLPTGMGKTAVQWMTIAETLRTKDGRVILVAPTNALVDQQHRDLQRILIVNGDNKIGRLTGSVPPAKRKDEWRMNRVTVATPQVVRNDANKGTLDLSEIDLLVVDEAHRATGNAAVAQLGDLLMMANPEARILGATASPGWNESSVEEVCERLHLSGIHARGSKETMLEPYASNLEVEEIKVPVPKELRELVKPLEGWLEAIVQRERRLGHYVRSGTITMGGLNEAMRRVQAAIAREERIAYRSAADLGVSIRLLILSNLLVSQGVAAARESLGRMEERAKAKGKEARSIQEFISDQRIRHLSNRLDTMDEIHSKVSFTRRVVRDEIRRNPDGKTIVFANYRDTVSAIVGHLQDIPGVRVTPFIGQTNRAGQSGMNSTEQIARLNSFRTGEYNVLVATSVGEEGLDIPRADLVLFYEPVGSEIRTIQRRGRTGRQDEGIVYVLIAEGTRDEGAQASALRREERMLIAIQRVRRRRRNFSPDLALLSSFDVKMKDDRLTANEFVLDERTRLTRTMETVDDTPINEVKDDSKLNTVDIPLEQRRPEGQSGLESWTKEHGDEKT